MAADYSTKFLQLDNSRCGENVGTLVSGNPYSYTYRPSMQADKFISGVTVGANAASLHDRKATARLSLCTSLRSSAPSAVTHSRYTVPEWNQSNTELLRSAEQTRNHGQQVKSDSMRVIQDTDQLTRQGQLEATRRIGERISDVQYYRHEILHEIDLNVGEHNRLIDFRRRVECLLRELETPLNVAREGLYAREQRIGIDHVSDEAELAMSVEIESIRSRQGRLCSILERLVAICSELRESQHCLERDALDKHTALKLDKYAQCLNNQSPGLALYPGIEQQDTTVSSETTYTDYAFRLLRRSQNARAVSAQFRDEGDIYLRATTNAITVVRQRTGEALARRIHETATAKCRLQVELSRVQEELADKQQYVGALRRALADKCAPLQVVHTRLERRSQRPCMENSCDTAQRRLLTEVTDIHGTIDQLRQQLSAAEQLIAALMRQKNRLENELQVKVNTLLIDRERVMAARRNVSIAALATKCRV